MTEINTERAFTPFDGECTIFANNNPDPGGGECKRRGTPNVKVCLSKVPLRY